MENNELSPDEYIDIAEKVRSGEYFRDSRTMVDIDIHDPMADRYWYIAVTTMSIFITIVAFFAWSGFYPLEPKVPFIFSTNDVIEDVPTLVKLSAYHNEEPNTALRRFLVQNYVRTREEYDAYSFDRSHNAIESLSTTSVLKEYDDFISPQNSNSPISLYQRHTQRIVTITGTEAFPVSPEDRAKDKYGYKIRIYFDAVLKKGESKNTPTKHQVDIAFQYKDIKLNEETGKISPYGFIVTSYQNKNL